MAEDGGAALADDDGLRVGEDGGDGEAAGALDVHEEGSGAGYQGLSGIVSIIARIIFRRSSSGLFSFVSYLQLVLLSLGGRAGVEEINCENLWKSCQHEILTL